MELQEKIAFIGITDTLKALFYTGAILSTALFIYGVVSKINKWKHLRTDEDDTIISKSPPEILLEAIRLFFSSDCLLARRVRTKSFLRSIMLIFVYWGFTLLFIGTLILGFDHYLKLHIMKGIFYLVFSFVLDIAGIMVLVGTTFYLLRRLIKQKEVISSAEDYVLLLLLFFIVLSGFFLEGTRLSIAVISNEFAPVGTLFSMVIKWFTDYEPGVQLYRLIWTVHVGSALVLIAYIPYSKLSHIIASQITTKEAENRDKLLRRYVYE